MDTDRIKILYKVTIFMFLLILARVIYLQYFDPALKVRSISNKVREEIIEPSRGLILDRNGVVLIDNQHTYNLYVVPERFLRSDYSIDFISEILRIDRDSLVNVIDDVSIKQDRYYRLQRNIDFSIFSFITEREDKLRGVKVKKEWTRNFAKITSPHVLGHLGEVRETIKSDSSIAIGELRGKEGIEYVYDKMLRGKKGNKKFIRDVKNNKISEYDKNNWKQAEKGKDIYLTIDYNLQAFVEEIFDGHSGTIIVENCNNGEILSMVSKPDFPLEMFSRKMSVEEWTKWSEDPLKPLYNKAILGLYPPGSVIKMASALAALENNVVSSKTNVYCPGGMQIGRRFMKCWKASGHGNVDLLAAIMHSCDTYFYNIAHHIDLDDWESYLSDLGFGQKTGIDLNSERSGLLPDEEYYRKRIKGNLVGRYANLMIGQGELLTTPLQIANYTCIIANGGIKFTPHLLLKAEADEGFEYYEKTKIDTIEINPKALKSIHKAMFNVVNVAGGTAYWSRSGKIDFAGKTGTAQNSHGADHAWFTSFGPFENPQITVTVFEEFGLHGSSMGKYAKKIFEYWNKNMRPLP
ncbi:MAG: penicillin-binding protein 2 [Candidatus Delongbacteria bacterium]|jgi:penicillin-binding protein 2|nr:penicillin-binding protein 2 [Candidatus Delongbacteria bacterium]